MTRCLAAMMDADTIDMSGLTSGVTVDFTDGEDGTIAGTGTDATFTEIETLILTDEDDVVNGGLSDQNMTIDGGAGDEERAMTSSRLRMVMRPQGVMEMIPSTSTKPMRVQAELPLSVAKVMKQMGIR